MDANHSCILNIIESYFLAETNFNSDLPEIKNTYEEHISKSESTLENVISLLMIDEFKNTDLPGNLVINTILLCGEHSEKCEWTSLKSIDYANQLLSEVLKRCGCSNLSNVLLNYDIDSFLSKLKYRIAKNVWKNYPASFVCFKWILTNIEFPFLGGHLDIVLPPALVLVDDHNYNNKVMGLQCLKHIAKNVSCTELSQYGRGTVMYRAIEHMVYLREPAIVQNLGPCLVALLSKTELRSTTTSTMWNHFDDILNAWLPTMEMEQNLALREAYIESLKGLVESMGLSSARWSNKIVSLLSEYTEQVHTCNKSLMTLQVFIKVAWPRISSHFNSIVTILMKTVAKISKKGTYSGSDQTLQLIKSCLCSLEKLCKNEFFMVMNKMKNDDELKSLYYLLKETEKAEIV